MSCELLSICDLTIFDTPQGGDSVEYSDVVNCFQFVIWRSLTHQYVTGVSFIRCCELLSICDLTIFDTPFHLFRFYGYKLWIAFNLWFDDLWHTPAGCGLIFRSVVNCFQFVIWRSLTHHCAPSIIGSPGCELLSICDLTIFDTPAPRLSRCAGRLWIAFNLWFDDLWHTRQRSLHWNPGVVNCFQFVIWRSLTHQLWHQ